MQSVAVIGRLRLPYTKVGDGWERVGDGWERVGEGWERVGRGLERRTQVHRT